jgi:DNA-directed RNA polymerase specialized sigma24 family protein
MPPADSVAEDLARLQAGDAAAAQQLCDRFFQQLITLARTRLGARRSVADEEDVALSAFDSFCRGAAAGRFPQLQDRDDLWKVLLVIVRRKAIDYANRAHRDGERGLLAAGEIDWGQLLNQGPTPALAAEMAEQCEVLLGRLDGPHRQVALWKMEGLTNAEIAGRLDVTPRTVERKLGRIRTLWGRGGGAAG